MAETETTETKKTKIVTWEILEYYHEKIKLKFVKKEAGKGLSSNDFTNELKNKLDNIVAGEEYVTTDEVDALFEDDEEETTDAGAGSGEASGDGGGLDGDSPADDDV